MKPQYVPASGVVAHDESAVVVKLAAEPPVVVDGMVVTGLAVEVVVGALAVEVVVCAVAVEADPHDHQIKLRLAS